jgi:hypothetical protein
MNSIQVQKDPNIDLWNQKKCCQLSFFETYLIYLEHRHWHGMKNTTAVFFFGCLRYLASSIAL